jgi:hypothetical protein
MRILFDHGTPRGLARALPEHTVTKTNAIGWALLTNGALLKAAEEAGFALLLSTDNNILYQQNLTGRKISILILTGCTKWSRVRLHFERIAAAVNAVTPGSYAEVFIPFTLNPSSRPRWFSRAFHYADTRFPVHADTFTRRYYRTEKHIEAIIQPLACCSLAIKHRIVALGLGHALYWLAPSAPPATISPHQ